MDTSKFTLKAMTSNKDDAPATSPASPNSSSSQSKSSYKDVLVASFPKENKKSTSPAHPLTHLVAHTKMCSWSNPGCLT